MFTAPQQFLIALFATLCFGVAATFGLGNQDQIVPRTNEAAREAGGVTLKLLRDARHGYIPGRGPAVWQQDVAEPLERRGILMADDSGAFPASGSLKPALERPVSTLQGTLLGAAKSEEKAASAVPRPSFAARGRFASRAVFVVGYRTNDEARAAVGAARAVGSGSGAGIHVRAGQVGNVLVAVVDQGNGTQLFRSTRKLVEAGANGG